MRLRPDLLCLTLLAAPAPAFAEYEFSLYTGNQSALASDITVRGDDAIPDSDFTQDWVGNSSTWPIYGGFRVTYWQTDTFGFGLDYAHNKVEPPRNGAPAGYDNLEFTDGLNTWTINAYNRWPNAYQNLTPYIGAGAGISLPGVEIRYLGSDTFEYQVTGLAVTWLAGVSYPINDEFSLFGEYKGTYTQNDVDLDGGGSLTTDIVTNAINIGISYKF